MQNKGFVKVIAVLLALICVYYLSFSFLLVMVSYEAETQIVDADKGKQYGDYFDKSFVLNLN